jgi:hypothetical protein
VRRASRTKGGRGILLASALLLTLLAVVDLMRSDSLLRAAWRSTVTDEGAPIERILRGAGIIHRR